MSDTSQKPEDLVYNRGPWKIYRQDAGMGEKEYRVFLNDRYFCVCDYRKDADLIIWAIRNNGSTKKSKLPENQILLSFKEKETAEYVRLICRRKSTDLESYILDNFEWDRDPACFDLNGGQKIVAETCDGCDEIAHCPDAVKP